MGQGVGRYEDGDDDYEIHIRKKEKRESETERGV